MEISIKGLDEAIGKLNDLQRRTAGLEGTHSVPFSDLFPTAFMQQHTRFNSIQEMIDASGHQVATTEDFEKIPEEEWEALVRARTAFPSWKEMLNAATSDWVTRKLGL